MFGIDKDTLARLKERYPAGCRVELTHMNDPYNTTLLPGAQGTVIGVDDIGTIHVKWDCGSSLGVVFGEDSCRKLDSVKVIFDGEEKVWPLRTDAIKFYLEAMAFSEGAERERYTRIYVQLIEGCEVCKDVYDE